MGKGIKRKDYLDAALDILDEDLQQMGVYDDYEIYGNTKTNVDNENVILLVDFPNNVTRAFHFPYDKDLKSEDDVKARYLDSEVRREINEAILEDATRRHIPINEVSYDYEESDYDEEECYGDQEYDGYEPFS